VNTRSEREHGQRRAIYVKSCGENLGTDIDGERVDVKLHGVNAFVYETISKELERKAW
jgi:hypothetical protein